MDEPCYVNCKSMKTQSIDAMNACSVKNKVNEDIGDQNCKPSLLHNAGCSTDSVIRAFSYPGPTDDSIDGRHAVSLL